MKRQKQLPETPMEQYRIYRNLSKTDLKNMTNLSRTTIEEACFGARKLTGGNLEKIAAALCVDTSDLIYTPSDPLKNVYDISQAMADIRRAISVCLPRQLEKKASQIIAYLGCDDTSAPAKLETAVQSLLSRLNDTGISLILYHLKYLYKEIPASGQTFVRKLEAPFQSLEFYREQRGLNIEELEHLSHISRQTLLKLRKGQKLSSKQAGQLAYALHVDTPDLIHGSSSSSDTCRVVDIRAAAAAVEEAVSRCKPSILKVRVPHILAYLKNTSHELPDVMAYLLTPSSREQRRLAVSYTETLCKYGSFHRDHTPSIYIGYCPSEYEEHVYDAYVLFEEWVYSMFCLDCPFNHVGFDIPDGYNHHVSLSLGLPITLWIERQPEEEDFEADLLEQIEEYCHNDGSEEIPDLELLEIFRDYVSDSLWASQIQQYESRDIDLERPFRLMRRQEQYQRLLYRLASLHTDTDLAETVARHFSWFKEDPEYERRLLEELELGEPV